MFGILSFFSSPKTPRIPTSYRPRVDELEERCCLDGSHITLSAIVQAGHMAQLSGTVSGGAVGNVTVTFAGAVGGATSTDSSGNFSYSTSNASLGVVSAVGAIMGQQTTDTAQATLAVAAPSLTLSISYGAQRTVTLSGKLTDIDAAGRTISFSGADTGSATTDNGGDFTFTTSSWMCLGTIHASETDLWGQGSNDATVLLASNAPAIEDFAAIKRAGTLWTIQGRVVDESAAGLIIRFGGNTSFSGQTATVQADGTFSLSIFLGADESGTVTAITTDWWGLSSDEVWTAIA